MSEPDGPPRGRNSKAGVRRENALSMVLTNLALAMANPSRSQAEKKHGEYDNPSENIFAYLNCACKRPIRAVPHYCFKILLVQTRPYQAS